MFVPVSRRDSRSLLRDADHHLAQESDNHQPVLVLAGPSDEQALASATRLVAAPCDAVSEAAEKASPAMRATNTTLRFSEAAGKPRKYYPLYTSGPVLDGPWPPRQQAFASRLQQLTRFLELAQQLQDCLFSMHSLQNQVKLIACVEEITRLLCEEIDQEKRQLEEGFLSRRCDLETEEQGFLVRELRPVLSFGQSLKTRATFAKQPSSADTELDSPLPSGLLTGGLASRTQLCVAEAAGSKQTKEPMFELHELDYLEKGPLASFGRANIQEAGFGASRPTAEGSTAGTKAEPGLAYDYSAEQYLRSYFSSLSLLGEKKVS